MAGNGPDARSTRRKPGLTDPLSRDDAADGPFPANPAGGGQGAVGFVACRQSIHQYTFLLASRPQPLGLPSILIFRRDRAPGHFSYVRKLSRQRNKARYCIHARREIAALQCRYARIGQTRRAVNHFSKLREFNGMRKYAGMYTCANTPNRIRTGVCRLRICCPGPLDDGGTFK